MPSGHHPPALDQAVAHVSSGQSAVKTGFAPSAIPIKPSPGKLAAAPNPHRRPSLHRFSAGSFFGGFRTPALLPGVPLAPGRHPKPFPIAGRWSSSEQPRTRHLKSKPFFLRMTMSESGQLNAAPSGILMPWNLITKPAIERYRPVMRGSTDGCLSPFAQQGFIADRSARRVRQNGRT